MDEVPEKTCHTCKEPKVASEFYRMSEGRLYPDCKNCHNGKRGQWATDNAARARTTKRIWQRSKLYGWPPGRFEGAWVSQSGCCAICQVRLLPEGRKATSVHADHDHLTGQPRELLCAGCNRGLGAFKDSSDLLEAAARYIRKHSRAF